MKIINKKMAKASAPGKLMLLGEHSVVYGHPCIVTAVNQRLAVTVERNGEDIFYLEAPDLGLTAYSKTIDDLGKKPVPKSVRFIETLYKHFLEKYPQDTSIHVITNSEFSSYVGFGSSSAVTVAFAKALTELYGVKLSNKELFDMCYQAVIDVQGVGSGFDLAAAIWGGTIYYVSPAKVVESLGVESLPISVGYTGVKADTPTLVRMVKNLKEEDSDKISDVFDQITNLVKKAKTAIKNRSWEKLGALMNQDQDLLRKLQVSSFELENLIQASQKHNALGAKLSGAGGGDCMLALRRNQDKLRVEQAIEDVGGRIIEVELNAPGVRIH